MSTTPPATNTCWLHGADSTEVREEEELQATNRLRLDGGVGVRALDLIASISGENGALERRRWLAWRLQCLVLLDVSSSVSFERDVRAARAE